MVLPIPMSSARIPPPGGDVFMNVSQVTAGTCQINNLTPSAPSAPSVAGLWCYMLLSVCFRSMRSVPIPSSISLSLLSNRISISWANEFFALVANPSLIFSTVRMSMNSSWKFVTLILMIRVFPPWDISFKFGKWFVDIRIHLLELVFRLLVVLLRTSEVRIVMEFLVSRFRRGCRCDFAIV